MRPLPRLIPRCRCWATWRKKLKLRLRLPRGGAGEAAAGVGGLSLNLSITDKTWISVIAGDHTLFTGLLQQQETKSFPLSEPLKLTIGNAGGVQLSVGGRNFRPLGEAGEVRVIMVSADNYQQYLENPAPGQGL